MNEIREFRGRFAFLSNFYPCKIESGGITYNSVEHYYVAQKVKGNQLIGGMTLTDYDTKVYLSKIESPGLVKKIGKTLSIRKDWDDIKLKVMEFGIREKFKDDKLLEMLLSTGDSVLTEGNLWHDNYWGVCGCPKCSGSGNNFLGKLLMKVRKDLSPNNPGLIIN
jgi:ribA/ribD-fused uncharacterized protein